MKFTKTLKIEVILILVTTLLCSSLFIFNRKYSNFDSLSWSSICKKLLKIQEQCRNARAMRKTTDVVELIAENGDLLILSISNSNSNQTLRLERRSLTRIKTISTIKNLSNISMDFKAALNGLPDQDLTVKAIYQDPATIQPLALFIDLSLSNPRLIRFSYD